jgi:hypothetical protein
MDSRVRSLLRRRFMAVGTAAVCLFSIGKVSAQPDTLVLRWQWLIGEWVGEGSGRPGEGSGYFTLTPDLDGRILVRKSHAEYPASGEQSRVIHDDLMVIVPGVDGRPGRAMYYDNEGHVIDYGLTESDTSMVFTSSRSPGVPVFRLIYTKRPRGRIDVAFQMSPDGEHFTVYTEGECRRK